MFNDDNKFKASASDHLANERTFLAWVRTSIALMGLGLVVVKFSLFVHQLSLAVTGHAVTQVRGFSDMTGMCLVAFGTFTALMGYLRYRRTERQLLDHTFYPSSTLISVLTAGIILGSFLLLNYLLSNR
jgi:putative membrane protein